MTKPTLRRFRSFTGCLLILHITSIPSALAAQQPITLQTAYKKALSLNPSLRVFQFRHDELIGHQETASLAPAVELNIETENFSGSGDFNNTRQAELTISLSSTLELGGKRQARMDVAFQNINYFTVQKQIEALEILGEVTRRYIDVLAAQERVALALKANQLAKEALTEVKNRANAGATPEAEVKRAQAATSQTHLTVFSEQSQLEYLKIALAGLWGRKTPEFSRAEGDLYHFGNNIPFETLYKRVEQNPAIQFFATQERLKDAELRLAKTQAKTDVRWSIGLRHFQDSDDTAVVAGFTMPLFTAQRSSGTLRSATASRNKINANKEATLIKLHTQLYHAFNNRKIAIHTAQDLHKDIVPSLEQALQETQKAYQRGRYSYIDYVTARQELLNAHRTLIDAAAAALSYGATIEQLTAEPLLIDEQTKQFISTQNLSGLPQ